MAPDPKPVGVVLDDGKTYQFAPLKLSLGVISLYDAVTGGEGEAQVLAFADAARRSLSASYTPREVDAILHLIDLEDGEVVTRVADAMFRRLRQDADGNAVDGPALRGVVDPAVGAAPCDGGGGGVSAGGAGGDHPDAGQAGRASGGGVPAARAAGAERGAGE